MKSKLGLLCCLSVISFGLMSCAPTVKLTTAWEDEALQGKKVEKIFVIGMLQDKAERELLENEFAEGLKARGNDAVASYPVLSFEKAADKETVKATAEVFNREVLLTTRQIEIKTVEREFTTESYRPCVYQDWPGPPPCGMEYVPGTAVVKDMYLVLETDLYDARTEKLLWRGQAEVWLIENDLVLIKSYVEVMLNRLSQDKVI
ncbi:MAG: hypothetical protein ABR903_11395 [Thermodesulfovibrionales bacterium]|jgi:hypothetical protein